MDRVISERTLVLFRCVCIFPFIIHGLDTNHDSASGQRNIPYFVLATRTDWSSCSKRGACSFWRAPGRETEHRRWMACESNMTAMENNKMVSDDVSTWRRVTWRCEPVGFCLRVTKGPLMDTTPILHTQSLPLQAPICLKATLPSEVHHHGYFPNPVVYLQRRCPTNLRSLIGCSTWPYWRPRFDQSEAPVSGASKKKKESDDWRRESFGQLGVYIYRRLNSEFCIPIVYILCISTAPSIIDKIYSFFISVINI